MNKEVKLYRKDDKGDVLLKSISRGMYKDNDSFQNDLDFWQGEGFYDNYTDALAAAPAVKATPKFK